MGGKYKPYPKYKASGVEWLGDVPEGWDVGRLKNVLKIRNGRDYKDIEVDNKDDGYPVYGSGGIFKYCSDYLYDGISILFGRKGTVDKPLIVNGQFWTVDTMFYSELYPHVNSLYIYNQSLLFPYDLLSTSTALPSITQGDLLELAIAIPPPLEQQQIADFLDREVGKIEALIAKQERLIELLTEKRQAVISHAVTKGLNPNTPTKPSAIDWLGDVPEHWDVTSIKYSCYLKGRVGWKGLTSDEYEEDSFAYLVTGTDFKNKYINWSTCYQVNEYRYKDDPYIQLKENDLLMTKDGTIGKLAIVKNLNKAACLNSGIFLIRPNPLYETDFLYWIFLSNIFKFFIDLNSNGSTILHLYQNVFENFSFAIPSLSEQQQIVDFLDQETQKIDSLIQKAQQMVTLLKERKTALISAAVTGKIDVRN